MIYYGNELYHHGIKGQKWGERNYQNPDGSLTPEGKRRYGIGKREKHYDSNGKKISNLRYKMIEKNKTKGMTQKDAEAKAAKTMKGLKIGAGVTAGVAVTAALSAIGLHAANKSYQNNGKVSKIVDNFMAGKGKLPFVKLSEYTRNYNKKRTDMGIEETIDEHFGFKAIRNHSLFKAKKDYGSFLDYVKSTDAQKANIRELFKVPKGAVSDYIKIRHD